MSLLSLLASLVWAGLETAFWVAVLVCLVVASV